MSTCRCFIAVEVADAVREAVARLQARLARADADVSWSPSATLHLTVAFLGDTPVDRIAELSHALDAVAGAFAPFTFRVAGLRSFGPPGRPRVLWAAIDPPCQMLQSLQNSLHSRIKELRFTFEDRPYVPHLTLGRVRSGRGLGDLTRLVESLKSEILGLSRVERVNLMRSQLNEPSVRHTVLHETRLKGE